MRVFAEKAILSFSLVLVMITSPLSSLDCESLFSFLSIPSISGESGYESDILKCCSWLEQQFKSMNMDVERWKTPGNPVVYASDLSAGPNKPTLLIYTHYDVQPVGPVDEWETPPFEPVIRDGNIHARGASDDKGQCFYVLLALKKLRESGPLPINIKLVVDGEEEIGSPGLSSILLSKQEALRADHLVFVDFAIPDNNTPTISLGTRGLVGFDITLRNSRTDLHSGAHGGLSDNALHILVEMLSSLHDKNGKVTIPGFYDDVALLADEDRKKISFDFDPDEYFSTFGTLPNGGEREEYCPLERNWARPTLEINGVNGGCFGKAFKTIIPAVANAKVSCRLVPSQDPAIISDLVVRHLKNIAPQGVEVDVCPRPSKSMAYRVSPQAPIVQAAARAYSEVFNKSCRYNLKGGSISIIPKLVAASGGEGVMIGMGLPTDNCHAPNEHFCIEHIDKGCRIIIRLIEILGHTI